MYTDVYKQLWNVLAIYFSIFLSCLIWFSNYIYVRLFDIVSQITKDLFIF